MLGQGPTQANQKKKVTHKTGRVNYLQITEAAIGAPDVACMFLANSYPTTILLTHEHPILLSVPLL